MVIRRLAAKWSGRFPAPVFFGAFRADFATTDTTHTTRSEAFLFLSCESCEVVAKTALRRMPYSES